MESKDDGSYELPILREKSNKSSNVVIDIGEIKDFLSPEPIDRGLKPVHNVDNAKHPYLRKEFHQKLFKNPHETVVAIALGSVKKAREPIWKLFILCIFGGLFVGVGASVAVITAGASYEAYYDLQIYNFTAIYISPHSLPGLCKIVFSAVFPIGLVFIILMGSELFTGNIMYFTIGVMAKKTNLWELVKSWGLSLLGNYIGCVLFALFIWACSIFTNNIYALTYLNLLVEAKIANGWGVTFFKAIPCNFLVCAAIFMSICAEDVISKLSTLWVGIFAFAVIGLEHCVANFFLFTCSALHGGDFNYGVYIYWHAIPAILGNIIGGGFFCGFLWWLLYYVSVEVDRTHIHLHHDPNINHLPTWKAWFKHFFGDCLDIGALKKSWKESSPDAEADR